MRKRAEDVDRTRRRITEAAVELHTSVGPARTTISALADKAGVTRLTVYRHFRDDEELFMACQAHWLQLHPRPDPESWRQTRGFEQRARIGLSQLYGWYRDNHDALVPILRDVEATPATALERRQSSDRRVVDALLHGVAGDRRLRRRLRAVAGHLISFWTWQSLVVDHGLSNDEAVEEAVRFLKASRRGARSRRSKR